MTDGQRDRGGARQGRQLPRFDPVAGMRAMADIQAEGLRAAGELLERVLRAEPNGRPMSPREPVGDYTAVVDAWVDLMRRMVAGFTQPVEPGAVTVPVDSSGVGPPIRLSTSDGGGSEASTEVWLHNGTFSSIGPLTMRCGPLTAPDGTSLENAEVTFAPRHVPALEARSSRGIVVSLAIEGSPAKGSYRGTIQADGAPRLWLPIEVVI